MVWWHLTAVWTVITLLSASAAHSVPGYLDFDNLPETNFTCEGKVIGGYYADIETGCQMFHVCTIGQKGDMTDIKFLCLNGTVFDQETRVCERVDEVDCAKSKDFYDLNLELYNNAFSLPEAEEERLTSSEEDVTGSEEELEEEYEDENYDTDTEPPVETSTATTTTTSTPKPTTTSPKPTYSIIIPNLPNKNTGTHFTGISSNKNTGIHQNNVPNKNLSPQPFDKPPFTRNKNTGTHLTGLTGPPISYKPYTLPPPPPTKQPLPPPSYINYNVYSHFTSTTPSPVATLFAYQNAYNAHKSVQQNHPSHLNHQTSEDTRPIVVVNHHFPSFQSKRKPSIPTILALQSQQQKVHRLHQEGLEIAEHRLAEVNNRNAEISHLQSQKDPESRRETKEIHSNPSVAVVTSTSSTSTSYRSSLPPKSPASNYQRMLTIARTTTEPTFKLELEKLFEKEENVDIEQLLLAWKLKTNRQLTVDEFEQLLSQLDLSQFQNGQAISLSDIFNIMNSTLSTTTVRVPPRKYEDYTEDDVPYDPFFKDVSKLRPIIGKKIRYSQSRSKREDVDVNVKSNGRFQTRRRSKTNDHVNLADIQVQQRAPSTVTEQHKNVRNENKENIRRRVRVTKRVNNSATELKQISRPNTTELSKSEQVTTRRPFPKTNFNCINKVSGGLYADVETNCEVFHICTFDGNKEMVDNKFFCGVGTLFNQPSRTCQSASTVKCSISPKYFYLNEQLQIPPIGEIHEELQFESKKVHK